MSQAESPPAPDSLESVEEGFFAEVVARGVGARLPNPFEGGELTVDLSLFLKAAMVRHAPVRLELLDGSYLDGLVHSSGMGGGRGSWHTLETARGLVEVSSAEITRAGLEPPALAPLPASPRQRPSSLAAEPVEELGL